MRQGDRQTAQACLEQHLQLVQQLGNWQGEINAWSKMAQLAAGGGGGASANGGEEGEGDGGENAGDARVGIGPAGDDGNRSGTVVGAIGQDSMVRALWCFERAAALAKAHDEVSDFGHGQHALDREIDVVVGLYHQIPADGLATPGKRIGQNNL